MQPEAIAPDPVPATTAPPLAARALSALQREMATGLLVVLIAAAALISPNFLTRGNLIDNLAAQIPVYGILAAGQMLVILSGGIDLSVGSVLAVSAFCAAVMSPYGLVPAIVVPIVVTALIGFANGAGVAFTRVPPFIITLAMLSVARGVALQAAAIYQGTSSTGAGAAGAAPVSVTNSFGFGQISQGKILGMYNSAIIALVVFVALAYALRYTRFGRHVFAVGGNETAAALLGVRVRRVKLAIYTISGALAGVAGVIFASTLLSAPPTAAQGYELDAITAVVVGGTLLTGGVGTVRGTIVGLLIIRILSNLFGLVGLDQPWQQVARGAVLLAVVLLQLAVVPGSRVGGLRLAWR